MGLFQRDENFNCICHEPKQNWMFLMGFFATEFSGTKPTYFLLLILTCLPLAIVISPPPVNKTWEDLCGSLQQEPVHWQHYRGKRDTTQTTNLLFYFKRLLADCLIFIIFILFLPSFFPIKAISNLSVFCAVLLDIFVSLKSERCQMEAPCSS